MRKSWWTPDPISPKILSPAPFFPIFDLIENCTADPFSPLQKWMNFNRSGRWEQRDQHCILYFYTPTDDFWDCDLEDDLEDELHVKFSTLQAKNLINQMLTVNPAKRIRAEEVPIFTILLSNQPPPPPPLPPPGSETPLDLPERESCQRVPQVRKQTKRFQQINCANSSYFTHRENIAIFQSLNKLHCLSPLWLPSVQARDGGLLEEVQREEEAERRHPHHHARLQELLKYVNKSSHCHSTSSWGLSVLRRFFTWSYL